MTGVSVIPPARGELVGDEPERRVEILSDHQALNATWSRFGPHREGADLHVHHHHTDVFYLLDGELTLRLGPGGDPVRVAAGSLAQVPPLVIHGFRNASDREVRYLNFHAPGMRFAEYLRALRDERPYSYDQHEPPADGGRSTSDALVGDGVLIVERPGVQVRLLMDAQEIAVALVRLDKRARSLPRPDGSGMESFYVLEGELKITVGGCEVSAGTGSWAQITSNEAYVAASSGPVRYLELQTPNVSLSDALRSLG